jgi:hypothetical protein
MNLYTLTANQQALVAKLEQSGFDSQTITDTLEGEENSLQLQEKRLGYIAIIKQKRALAAMRIQAAKDIDELGKQDELAAERLEAALFQSMQNTGDKDLIGVEFEAHIQGKAAAVEIIDPALVPRKYWITPEPKVPVAAISKTLIGADLKAGIAIEGAKLGINKKLVIK